MGIEVESPPHNINTRKKPPPEARGGVSRVLNMEETLGANNSSLPNSPTFDESVNDTQDGSNVMQTSQQIQFTVAPASLSNTTTRTSPATSPNRSRQISDPEILARDSISSQRDTMSLQSLKSSATSTSTVTKRVGAPWVVFLIAVLIHCGAWTAVSSAVFEVNQVLSIHGVLSIFLTLDPGNWLYQLGTPNWILTTSFLVFLLLGKILAGALFISIWAKLSEFLTASGKELCVTTPVMVRS